MNVMCSRKCELNMDIVIGQRNPNTPVCRTIQSGAPCLINESIYSEGELGAK